VKGTGRRSFIIRMQTSIIRREKPRTTFKPDQVNAHTRQIKRAQAPVKGEKGRQIRTYSGPIGAKERNVKAMKKTRPGGPQGQEKGGNKNTTNPCAVAVTRQRFISRKNTARGGGNYKHSRKARASVNNTLSSAVKFGRKRGNRKVSRGAGENLHEIRDRRKLS